MGRITPQVKAIADAHIQARQSGKFDNPTVRTREELFEKLSSGQTFEEVLRQIEVRFASIGSILMSTTMLYVSQSYKSAVYKGFKALLQK